jgi:hypothetical protein
MIGAEAEFQALKRGSHMDATWSFLQRMRDLGHTAGERWTEANLSSVGVRPPLDLSSFAEPLMAGRDAVAACPDAT